MVASLDSEGLVAEIRPNRVQPPRPESPKTGNPSGTEGRQTHVRAKGRGPRTVGVTLGRYSFIPRIEGGNSDRNLSVRITRVFLRSACDL